MIQCIMIGDSIAVGVGQARPECETIARVGISSARYVATMLPRGRTSAGTAVISLGVNDGDTTGTLDNLREVRSRIDAPAVVWLLPGLKEDVRDMIRTVAAENNDRTLDTRPQVGRDHLHPTGRGYETIAAATIGPANGDAPGVEVAFAPDEDRQATVRQVSQARHTRHQRTIRHAGALRTHGLHVSRSTHHAGTRAASGKTLASACTTQRSCHRRSQRS